jgi:hypothetical protein
MLIAAPLLFAGGPLPWGGPVIPMDGGNALLAVECKAGSSIKWSRTLQHAAHGMAPGDLVWILAPEGVSAGVLGRSLCYGGECGGAYASLKVNGANANTARAIVPRRFFTANHKATPIHKVADRKGRCSNPPHLQWKAGRCTTWSTGVPGTSAQMQTEVREDEEGGESVRQHVRSVHKGATSAWRLLSDPSSEFGPVVAISDIRDGVRIDRILWIRGRGIDGPQFLTVLFSEVRPDGTFRWGREYSAGGQPCD